MDLGTGLEGSTGPGQVRTSESMGLGQDWRDLWVQDRL